MNQDFEPGPEHFVQAEPSFGGVSFAVTISGMVVRFEGLSEAIRREALGRYGPFVGAADAGALHTVSLHAGAPAYLAPAADRLVRFSSRRYPEGETLTSLEFAALRSGSRGMLRVSTPGNVQSTLGSMENYLRWVIADLALPRDAFVLHSCGAVRNGKAYVFFGHSGAGKSTVAALSADAAILSDDLVLLQRTGNGIWHAVTTPFAGTFPQQHKTTGAFPLHGLYHLNKADAHRIEPLSRPLAAGKLLSCCPFVSPEARTALLVPLIEDLCNKTAVFDLHFSKDPGFWELI